MRVSMQRLGSPGIGLRESAIDRSTTSAHDTRDTTRHARHTATDRQMAPTRWRAARTWLESVRHSSQLIDLPNDTYPPPGKRRRALLLLLLLLLLLARPRPSHPSPLPHDTHTTHTHTHTGQMEQQPRPRETRAYLKATTSREVTGKGAL
jgi:hypothetical protein